MTLYMPLGDTQKFPSSLTYLAVQRRAAVHNFDASTTLAAGARAWRTPGFGLIGGRGELMSARVSRLGLM